MDSRKSGIVLAGVTLAAVAVVFIGVDPMPQWPEYHEFADRRAMLGITNAHNVLSNLGFVVVGAWGLLYLSELPGKASAGRLVSVYRVFFAGLILTGMGSAWYHLAPDNEALVWDRLPMTIMFMGFFASVIGEMVSMRAARRWLLPLLLAGAASVTWWAWTESIGAGDLRAYGLVQFLPIVLVILMLILYPAPPRYAPYVVAMILIYGLAKMCEELDAQIFAVGGVVSGHALKHLLSALAAAAVLLMLNRRGAGPEFDPRPAQDSAGRQADG